MSHRGDVLLYFFVIFFGKQTSFIDGTWQVKATFSIIMSRDRTKRTNMFFSFVNNIARPYAQNRHRPLLAASSAVVYAIVICILLQGTYALSAIPTRRRNPVWRHMTKVHVKRHIIIGAVRTVYINIIVPLTQTRGHISVAGDTLEIKAKST